jgi:hypothetical protein
MSCLRASLRTLWTANDNPDAWSPAQNQNKSAWCATHVCQPVEHGCLRSEQQLPAARSTAAMFHSRLGVRYEKSRFVPKMVTKRLSISGSNSDSIHAKTEQTSLK